MTRGTLISGKWTVSLRAREVMNPFSGEKVGEVPLLEREQVIHAIEDAATFHSSLTPYERFVILRNAANMVMERKDEIACLISSESGLALKDTRHEVERTHNVLLLSAEEAKRQRGSVYQSDVVPQTTGRVAFTIREPAGLILAITPFNHPMNQVAHKIGPAIAMNNTVLLKPSLKTPLSAIRLTEILLEAGLPPRMLSVLTLDVMEHARFLLSHPAIDMVCFTGSTESGEKVLKETGVKKTLMELGGNDVCILCEDADVSSLIDMILIGGLGNSGQRCTSIKRLLCHRSIADVVATSLGEAVSRLCAGDPLREDTDIGTVIDEEAAMTIERRIQQACAMGAKLLIGGRRKGALIEPTLVDYIRPDMELVQKETFGPVIPLIRFDSDDEAIRMCNDTPFGLQSGVCTNDLRRAMRYVQGIRAGAVHVNQAPGYRVESWPFGGIKKSGFGKEGVERACLEMSTEKLISLPFPPFA
ncbi:MAG: aldehyde dehydrogenase family protein [Candidatus Peribacteraceae bacterium]|nr:aldehyde dehydrogenase family protein [Candidatus Peribacteraceae bacterium]